METENTNGVAQEPKQLPKGIEYPPKLFARLMGLQAEINALIEGWAIGQDIDLDKYTMLPNGIALKEEMRKLVGGRSAKPETHNYWMYFDKDGQAQQFNTGRDQLTVLQAEAQNEANERGVDIVLKYEIETEDDETGEKKTELVNEKYAPE